MFSHGLRSIVYGILHSHSYCTKYHHSPRTAILPRRPLLRSLAVHRPPACLQSPSPFQSSTLGDPASSNGHLPRSSSQPNTEETPRVATTVDPPCRRRLTRKGQSQSVDDPSTPEIVVSEDDGTVAPPEGSQSQEDVSCQEVKSTRRSFRKTKSKVCNVL